MIFSAGEPLRDQFLKYQSQDWFYFFALFGRFEYAMKRGGFLRDQDLVEPAWWTFANEFDQGFWARFERRGATAILFCDPPRILERCCSGSVFWASTVSRPSCNRSLFDVVKAVRNNMFHGDKTTDGRRDNALIRASTKVLEEAWEVTGHESKFKCFQECFMG